MFDEWHNDLTNFLNILSKTLHFELVELVIVRRGRVVHVEAFIDKESGGITIDECSLVNKQLSGYIEEKNLIAEDYVVEVSSPGLDRPLKTKKDFLRVKGFQARFHLNEMLEGKKEYMGVVLEVNDQAVKIENKKMTMEIQYNKIHKAVLILD